MAPASMPPEWMVGRNPTIIVALKSPPNLPLKGEVQIELVAVEGAKLAASIRP